MAEEGEHLLPLFLNSTNLSPHSFLLPLSSFLFPLSSLLLLKIESSVPISRVLFRTAQVPQMPVIYLICKSPCILSVLPSIGVSRAGNPQTMVYMNLQPPVSTAQSVTRSLVVSYTAFSPLPCFVNTLQKRWRLFSSALTCCRQHLLFSEVEHPMLPGLSSYTLLYISDRAGTLLSTAKVADFF